ncbi:MAG: hypothetical protein GWN58_27885 [Anaerolineae bacterium]|nr:hypothetical protein [Anaerolineae bacterium]
MFKRTHYRTKEPKKRSPCSGNIIVVGDTGEATDIYLLCAKDYHYIGSTDREIETRVGEHWRGNGAAFTAWLKKKGYKPILARTWLHYDKCVEFRLKAWGGARPFCPICSGEAAWKRARYEQYIIEPAEEAPAEELPF